MIIREVKKTDNKMLAAIIRSTIEEFTAPRTGTVYSDPTTDRLYELFRMPRSKLWIAVTDKIAGCCGIFPTENLPEDCAELVKFYLAREARGQGIGKSLMEKCIQTARDFGYKSLYIESVPEFSAAVRMYEKQGFVPINHRLGNSGHSSCNIWMLKTL